MRGGWGRGFEVGKVGSKKARKENQLKGMCMHAYICYTQTHKEKRGKDRDEKKRKQRQTD